MTGSFWKVGKRSGEGAKSFSVKKFSPSLRELLSSLSYTNASSSKNKGKDRKNFAVAKLSIRTKSF
jgi:hypothetical protein